MRLSARTLLVLCISPSLAACGYHVAGHYSTLPKTIHVIAVPALENKTTTYRIEQKLTAATIHEFLAKTRYRVVSDPNGGDAVLRGKVLSVEIIPLTFQTTSPTPTSSIAQATTMLVIMKCEVTFTERDTEKVLYHNDNFVFRNEYELGAATQNAAVTEDNVRSFFQESDPAFDRMAQDFAGRLVAAVTENY
jgi:outer membrane lipopolysaccharide assembly protein LptE/RlpB